ncbi:HNH endonuclease domain-containing protein [Salegentibacter sp. F188]|uniref:HNH endonuclease domain-containing protein n=1 Tax=Autumnicola patrickiae TaxID=3075591 RepID=A0ABU3DYF7_9FLAO|nr:HNH endonuclease domain-containing protein [Salegentibacter sp. F188]MDT0688746.1 HNH endonuclease domain-containing protein [Salegentibacter sp. F188]
MVVLVWYPINYFKISFGKQDQLGKLVKKLKAIYSIPDDISEDQLRDFLEDRASEKELSRILNALTRYVPYRFIRPWFLELVGVIDGAINRRILELQESRMNRPPYQIKDELISFNSDWLNWIRSNLMLIEKFTLFELFRYVEKNNPNTPNISLKLFKPQQRKLTQATNLWKGFVDRNRTVRTVFEKKPVIKLDVVSIDHYIPWSYLTHDQLWNLHPTEKISNSSKGNKLPHSSYSSEFCLLQYQFVRYLISEEKEKYLLDYNNFLFISTRDLAIIPRELFQQKLREKMEIHLDTAQTMGFSPNWFLD